MRKPIKWPGRQRELTSIAILMLRYMEITLSPIERIIFLRLLLCYGGRKISVKSLTHLAEEIKVHRLALKKVLAVLIEKGLLEQLAGKAIRIKKELLPRQIDYSRKNNVADTVKKIEVVDIPVEKSKKDEKTGLANTIRKQLEIQKSAYQIVSKYKKSDFLYQLFSLIFQVKISHKQKDTEQLLELNYQQWLVLVNLVTLSDESGVVHNAGTYLLSNRTGMNRDALLRAITALFELGIIRSKIHGSLNHNLLASDTPIYYLNLSASIWGEYRKFGTYYFLKLPDEYTSIVEQFFKFFELCGENSSDNNLKEISFINTSGRYHIFSSTKLAISIRDQINFATKIKNFFLKDIQLMKPDFKQGRFPLNTFFGNVNRIDFLLQSYLALYIKNFVQAEMLAGLSMTMDFNIWLSKYLKKIQLSPEDFATTSGREHDCIETLASVRAEIFFKIVQAILKSELLPMLSLIRKYSDVFRITYLPVSHSEYCDKIYYFLDQGSQRDYFRLVEFVADSTHPIEYVLKCTDIDLTFEEQKEYGLFNSKKAQ